ncbi:type-1 angiotensin II receptor-associated protein isoform X3 [Dromiciops gliroides]|uniref:type-1 angiotensin II receptor-associated protein isoform X3 n=1 Tax=Dromiciops gliroides TaxID=33562 RepID=UPI001CC60069|nr:type-1 angiotensin II receptor-associated protein isoform X3 [Dromiciops gliroides]
MELPAVNLKAIVLVHWLLTTWGCYTFSNSYAWANFTVLALGVWSIAQRDSLDAIIMRAALSDTERFSTGMAIFSLLLKPLSCIFVYHMYQERGGEFVLNIGSLGPSQERSAYQTIDSQEDPALAHPYADLESKPAARPY